MLTYRIYSGDAFGHRSAPATIRIFLPDFHAPEPPQLVTAIATAGKIIVNWPTAQKPNPGGYLVERAFLDDGPYEALFTQALPPTKTQYEDDSAQGGDHILLPCPCCEFARRPGCAVACCCCAGEEFRGSSEGRWVDRRCDQVRVRLTWKPVVFPVAGYFVERRVVMGAAAAEPWVRLNARVTSEPLYDDPWGWSPSQRWSTASLPRR